MNEDSKKNYFTWPIALAAVGILAVVGFGIAKYQFSGKRAERVEACNTTFKVEYHVGVSGGSADFVAENDKAGAIFAGRATYDGSKWTPDYIGSAEKTADLLKERAKNEGFADLGFALLKGATSMKDPRGCIDEITDKLD